MLNTDNNSFEELTTLWNITVFPFFALVHCVAPSPFEVSIWISVMQISKVLQVSSLYLFKERYYLLDTWQYCKFKLMNFR